jgi:hypothetical protein
MNIIRLLKNNITVKKILKNSGRITHAFLLENRENMPNNLILLCKVMRISASFCQTTSHILVRNTFQAPVHLKQSP